MQGKKIKLSILENAVLLLAGTTLKDGIEDGNRAADALVRGAALDKFVQRDFSVTIAVHFLWGRKKANKKNVRVYRQESSNTSQQCSKINRPADARLAPFALMAGTPLLSFLFCSVFTAPFSPKSLIFGLRGAGQFWLIKLNCHTFADKNGQLPKRIIGG